MDRIKDLSKVVVRGDTLFAEIFGEPERKTKGGIYLPDNTIESKQDSFDYMEVIVVGKDITDVEVGDIILDVAKGNVDTYIIGEKPNQKKYGKIARFRAEIVLKPDNFDSSKKKEFVEVPELKKINAEC